MQASSGTLFPVIFRQLRQALFAWYHFGWRTKAFDTCKSYLFIVVIALAVAFSQQLEINNSVTNFKV